MKKIVYSVLAITAISLASWTTLEGKKENTTLKLDKEATKLNWLGKYVSDGHTHTGVVKVTNGTLEMKNNEISSGNFIIDMKTIENFDLPQEKKGYLIGHLNSAEFFNTEKYSQVPVKITGKSGDKLNIELIVLDKTIKTEIPYEVKADDKKVNLKSKFTIDFAVLDVAGFKAKDGKPANERTDTKVDFDLNLVLNY